jgi:hypothetical protein
LAAAEVAFALLDVFADFRPFVLVVAETVREAGTFEIGEKSSDDGVDGSCVSRLSVQHSFLGLALAGCSLFFLHMISTSHQVLRLSRTENSDSTPAAICSTKRGQRCCNDNLQAQTAIDESAGILVIALALQLGRADPCVDSRVWSWSTAAIGVGRREFASQETMRSAERFILCDYWRDLSASLTSALAVPRDLA